MPALDAVHTSTSDHFADTVHDVVDLFSPLVMVGKVGAARRKLHHEQTGDRPSGRDPVALAFDAAHQQAVLRRGGMAFDALQWNVVYVGDREARRDITVHPCLRWHSKTHDEDPAR